jgi:3-hydroxyisobutyrate dehydrogenase-like beta-hydroxyacid dehydrogenase
LSQTSTARWPLERHVAELGYVGLGVMGGGIAKRLLDAGHTVTGWNRTREKAQPLLDAGMAWADTPREVAEHSEITFTMVTNTAAVQAVTEGPDGILAGLSPGKVYVDMSTASPDNSRAIAARVAALDAYMLDAPVSGSVITLEQGKLAVMVGGDEEVFTRVRPVLEAIGPKVFHVGPNGAAVTIKIASNLQLAVQMLAFSEAVLIAEKSGIPREKAVEVLLGTVIASPMVTYRGPFVLEQPEEAWFDVNMMQKDMNLALELGRDLDVPLPTTAVTNELLTAARGMGLEHRDFAVLFDTLAAMAGIDTGLRR